MPDQVTAADARTYLGDFVDVKSLEGVPDADVLSMHGKVSAAVAKHAPKPTTDPNKPWYGDFQDSTVKDWLGSYKDAYPSAEAVALKALNLEKFLGAEKAGRGVVMPKADAKPEEWKAFWTKAGLTPQKADGYKIPEKLAKEEFTIKFRDFAHGIGMPSSMFEPVMGFIQKEAEARAQNSVERLTAAAEKEMGELRTEWGTDYDKKAEMGQRAAAAFIPHKDKDELADILTKMEGVLGTKFLMNLWASIGEGLVEHGFVMTEQVGEGGGITPEAARNRIAALKNDKEFGNKLLKGDVDAKTEWDKLHRIGYGALAPAGQ